MSPLAASEQRFAVDGALDIQELHEDLARKYKNVGDKVAQIWRNFNRKQKEAAVLGSTGDGQVLLHSRDTRMGVTSRICPGYAPVRAEKRLDQQLYEGVNGYPGDRELIRLSGNSHCDAIKDEYTCFLPGEHYGRSFCETAGGPGTLASMATQHGIFVPSQQGKLIVIRQGYLMSFLNGLIEEIMTMGSVMRAAKATRPPKPETLVMAISNLKIKPQPLKSSFPEIVAQAAEQKASLEDHLNILCDPKDGPFVLYQSVQSLIGSRLELIPDARGQILPDFSNKYSTPAYFETVASSFKGIAIWAYVESLLQKLGVVKDKARRRFVLQELTNICHFEFRRAQSVFKRHVSNGWRKHFKRIQDPNDHSAWKIVMREPLSKYTVSDPQVHYILQLCHKDTSPSSAAEWIRKLDDHNNLHTDDRERLSDVQMLALGDLAIVTSFMHSASTALAMVPVSGKSGLLFTSRAAMLEETLRQVKDKADFGDFLIPVGNLLEPGVAAGALAAMRGLVTQEAGAPIECLYQDVVERSLADLENLLAAAGAKAEAKQAETTFVPLPAEAIPTGSSLRGAQAPSRKEKTHGGVGGTKDTTTTTTTTTTIIRGAAAAEDEIPAPATDGNKPQRLKAKASTVSLFATLFSRSSGAKGSVPWTDFEAAMADLDFEVTPTGGSVYRFHPPPGSMAARPITLHRPHASDIEGYRLLILARRLQRAFGWGADTFEAIRA